MKRIILLLLGLKGFLSDNCEDFHYQMNQFSSCIYENEYEYDMCDHFLRDIEWKRTCDYLLTLPRVEEDDDMVVDTNFRN